MKLIATLLIASSAASAFVGNCDGNFSGEVQALYWRTSHCPILYARGLSSNGVSLRDDHFVQADYDWGFRVGVGYERRCTQASLSYLYLQTTDGVRVKPPSEGSLNIQGQSRSVDFAQTALKFRYQNVDLKVFQRLHHSCGCTFSVAGLLRWADIDMKNRTFGTFESKGMRLATVSQSATFDGAGVGIGFAGDYCLPCDFLIGGYFDFAAIIGKQKIGKLTSSDVFNLVSRPGNGVNSFVPTGQFDLFISYSRCMCRALWNLKLGYEMHYYWNALRYSAVHNDQDAMPVLGCYDVGFGGPYLGLSASF